MRKACIIGIDNYEEQLNCCVNDARYLANLLETHPNGASNFSVKLFENIETKDDLEKEVTKLFKCENDVEIALFYFSGHGYFDDNLGGQLVAIDFPLNNYNSNGLSMNKILELANTSKAQQRIIILDCCHAGAIGESHQTSFLTSGVTIMASCSQDELSIAGEDGITYSIFTRYLIEALRMGASFPSSIYAHIIQKLGAQKLGAWGQRPVFKTNVHGFVQLRNSLFEKENKKSGVEDKRLVRIMNFGGDKLESVLGASISSSFAKGVIRAIEEDDQIGQWDRDRIFNNLKNLYEQKIDDHSLRGHYIRQNCCYYIAHFRTPASKDFIEEVCEEKREKSPFVLRGAYIASDEKRLILKYLRRVRKDAEWASINAGYHQCYYKDKLFDEGYHFDITIDSKNTLSAIIKRLDKKDRKLLPLEIFTLIYIFTNSDKNILNEEQIKTIDRCIKNKSNYDRLSREYLKKLELVFSKIVRIADRTGYDEYYYNEKKYIKKLLSARKAETILYEYREKFYIDKGFYSNAEIDERSIEKKRIAEETKAYKIVKCIENLINLKNIGKKINLLDVGCSLGYFIPAWKKVFDENSIDCLINGVDISSSAIEKGRKFYGESILCRYDVFDEEIVKLYQSTGWNIICCFDFIEHCFDIDLFLYRLKHNTPNDVILIIYIPILEIGNDKQRIDLKNYSHSYNHHIYYFSEEGIKKLMKDNGFKCTGHKYFKEKRKSILIFDKQGVN